MVQALIFDKDGTLFDFEKSWGAWALTMLDAESDGDAGRLADLAERLGYDVENQRFQSDSIVIAGSADEVAEAMLPGLPGDTKPALIDRMNVRTAQARQVEAVPLAPYFADLHAKGFKLGLATNDAEAPARAHLAQAAITQYFDFIAGCDSGFGAKPAPGQLLAFADQVALAPESCAMVGDSTHDLHAARAAGMISIGVLTGMAGAEELAPHADVVLPDIGAIPAWLATRA